MGQSIAATWPRSDALARHSPLLIAESAATLIIGALFMADALTGSKGFNPETWGQFAYAYPAEMWAALMLGGSLLCIIGLIRPVQAWMVAVGSSIQFAQFAAIAYSAIYTDGEYVIGIYASVFFMPLYAWLCVQAIHRSAR